MRGWGSVELQKSLDLVNEKPAVDAIATTAPQEILDVPHGERPPAARIRLLKALFRRFA